MFRFEREPANLPAGRAYRISDLELASRLSFFIWSSIPDDELLGLAIENKLHDPAVLEAQTRRMLKDPRSETLVTDFGDQWLYLRELKNQRPEAKEFNDNLRQSFRRETELLLDSILREDRSVIDLLNADYTFVDEALAQHYGIPNVRGTRFRRVAVQDEARRGLLGQSSFLLVTSVANRTSPVARGKWVLENLLGTPAPLPPPNVPPLDTDASAQQAASVRQRMEEHRKNPTCAACHKIMDPIGFSLENFDLIGRYRASDGGIAHRRLRPVGGRHQAGWSRQFAARALQPLRRLRPDHDREASHLRHRPGAAAITICPWSGPLPAKPRGTIIGFRR